MSTKAISASTPDRVPPVRGMIAGRSASCINTLEPHGRPLQSCFPVCGLLRTSLGLRQSLSEGEAGVLSGSPSTPFRRFRLESRLSESLVTVPTIRSIVRTIAVDYDGTVALDGHLSQTGAAALEEARQAGLLVVLVTGRIFDELARVAPGISDRFDVIVAENGAVAVRHGQLLRLAEPVDDALIQELTRLGTGVRRGQVIAAVSGSQHQLVEAAIERHGLDCQIVTNRSELMILPRGVSKASGLEYAIEALDRSPHTTLAIGDAENDLAMLMSCEIGAAVGGSVDVLRQHADVGRLGPQR